MLQVMVTTVDNDFDPFDEFDKWYTQDMMMGYNTCGRLAKLERTSDAMSEMEKHKEHVRAVDELIALDFTNTFIKVEREVPNKNLELYEL